ncbi:MAG TPA: TIM barrel protein [Bryobacteraceae bacterium]|jgi:sugar phosphate isomerase/epimerase|nr:TIM barrel protein [Bryobacteraceae bacterium]
MTRRTMLNTTAAGAALAANRPTGDDISLAAWSINRSFFGAHRWKNLDLPQIAREQFDITGLEFVNQFFENPVMGYLNQLRKNGDAHGVRFVLIMVDGEGDMSAVDKKQRIEAAVAHRKWVDIAHYLGCHAIRCNMGGPRQNWKSDGDLVSRAAESFHHLLDYAKQAELNVIIENHGGASSDPDVVVKLMKAVDDPNFGTLPDFGNINPGDDNAEVIRKIVPWAKGISVKASWAADGMHPGWNLEKIIRICQDAGYHGFWGIESNFARNSPEKLSADQIWENELKGVRLTKAVLDRVVLKKG